MSWISMSLIILTILLVSFVQNFKICLSQNSTTAISWSSHNINIQFSVLLRDFENEYIFIMNCSSSIPLDDCATDFFSRYSVNHYGFQQKLIRELYHRLDLLHQNLTSSLTVAIPTLRRWDFLQKTLPVYLKRSEVAEVMLV